MRSLTRNDVSHIIYDRRKQFWSILKRYTVRWISTAVLLAGFIAVGKGFESLDTLESIQKGYLNSVNIALALLLGMNTTGAIRSFGRDLRWYMLSRKSWHLPVAERILDYENLSSVVWIAFHRTGHWMQTFSLFWIFMSIGLQAAIAVLGIGFDFDKEIGILSRNGDIWVGNLTEFNTNWSENEVSLSEQQATAYMFANFNNYIYGLLTDEENILDMEAELELNVPQVLISADYSTATARFRNYNRNDLSIFRSSDRSVAATSNCALFEVIEDDQLPDDEITIKADKTESQVQLPTSAAGNTIYYTNPDEDCGPRCAQVSVYRPSHDADDDSHFYKCTVEVSEVKNAKHDFEKVSDKAAKIAAGVITINGEELSNSTMQYQRFAENSILKDEWSGNITILQASLSSYAVESLLGLSESLPGVNTTGEQPFLGSSVDVEWALNISVISGIGAFELILALVAAFFASKVVVFDSSAVSLTLLLEDITNDVKLKGINNLKRSDRRKDYNCGSDRYYRYGYTKARAESEIDYNLTLKATDQTSQREFPAGYYGKESPRPIVEDSKGFYEGLKNGLSRESTSLYERAVYQPKDLDIP